MRSKNGWVRRAWRQIFPASWYGRAREEEDRVKAELERREDLVRREVERIAQIQRARGMGRA